MNTTSFCRNRRPRIAHGAAALQVTLACLAALIASSALADQVEMQNGDRYVGHVLVMSTNSLTMQNEVLGNVTLPRGKIARVTFGETTVPAKNSLAVTNAAPRLAPPTKASTNVIEQVQQQYLADAPPAARAKYNELAGGLLSGKLGVADIRVEAQSAADQLRKFKADLGGEGGESLDGYLAILENFLNETKSSDTATTNAPATALKSKPAPARDDD
jgi:hypothetical protein